MNWISVKDRFPNKEGVYICFDGTAVGFAEMGMYRFSISNNCQFVTHWMELPNPPDVID